ncbi:unnamed protein product [Linum trigynum]|uniref:Retrotransposon Copia-like N-terminal domain-containing protein n=1 Tax=Linum trigynum TaxID=586398 RepID=A0AAV2FCY6_9ROSI
MEALRNDLLFSKLPNPYYINPNESLVIPLKLTPKNYHSWCRTVRLPLRSRNKLGFINGTLPPPSPTNPAFDASDQSNTAILFALMSSLDPTLIDNVNTIEMAQGLRDDLKERFGQDDFVRITELQTKFYSLNQGSLSVSDSYTKLKMFWDYLSQYEVYPAYACNPCATYVKFQQVCSNSFVLKFIQGLGENFEGVKTNLLMMKPLPDSRAAFAFALQRERQNASMVSNLLPVGGDSSLMALAASLGKEKENFKQEGHLKYDCPKLKNKRRAEHVGGSVPASYPQYAIGRGSVPGSCSSYAAATSGGQSFDTHNSTSVLPAFPPQVSAEN